MSLSILPSEDIEVAADIRDMRDPELLGQKMLELRQALPNAPLSLMYDKHAKYLDVPNYDGGPVNHAEARDAELRARAAEGDRFAEALLRGDTLAEEPVD